MSQLFQSPTIGSKSKKTQAVKTLQFLRRVGKSGLKSGFPVDEKNTGFQTVAAAVCDESEGQ